MNSCLVREWTFLAWGYPRPLLRHEGTNSLFGTIFKLFIILYFGLQVQTPTENSPQALFQYKPCYLQLLTITTDFICCDFLFPKRKCHCCREGVHICGTPTSQVLTTQPHLDFSIPVGQSPTLSWSTRYFQSEICTCYAVFPFSIYFLTMKFPATSPWAQYSVTSHVVFLPTHPDVTIDTPDHLLWSILPIHNKVCRCKYTQNICHNYSTYPSWK